MALEKLTIKVYEDIERDEFLPDDFTVMFNPESYSLSYTNKFEKCQGINTNGKQAAFSFSQPEELSLKLIIDGTEVRKYGAVRLFSASDDVHELVHEFLEKTCYMEGNIHEPRFLKIMWGELAFKCRLQSVNVNYTLFDRSGKPTRAELDTKFIRDEKESDLLKMAGKTSPDLTHTREVQHGENLPLMVKNIYKTPDHYIHVARVNGLKRLRDLSIGDAIYFPPLAK